ncbi:MAG TPA: hypothetical protein VGC07_03795 [Granulicella sp.]
MNYCQELVNGGASEDAVFEEFESIAAELDDCLCDKLSEDVATAFVETVMFVKRKQPAATTFGVFSAALQLGLTRLAEKISETEQRPARKTKNAAGKRRVRGV